MAQPYPLRIDAYAHIIPPKYKEMLYKMSPQEYDKKVKNRPPLWNLDERFKIMDHYGELVQVITLGWPVIEDIADPIKAVELARLSNDEMAELVLNTPTDLWLVSPSCPLNNMDAAMKLEHAIVDQNCGYSDLYAGQ
jgi:aminocarboxymuconate-semialdehyde decarboxylase